MDDEKSRDRRKGPAKVLIAFLSALATRAVADWFNDWRRRHGL